MICNRVASTRATIYSLRGGLPTAIFINIISCILFILVRSNKHFCLSVCLFIIYHINWRIQEAGAGVARLIPARYGSMAIGTGIGGGEYFVNQKIKEFKNNNI